MVSQCPTGICMQFRSGNWVIVCGWFPPTMEPPEKVEASVTKGVLVVWHLCFNARTAGENCSDGCLMIHMRFFHI